MTLLIDAFLKYSYGATTSTLQADPIQLEILQVSQEVRSRLSMQAFILVLLVACVYSWALWERTNQVQLILWSSAVVLTAAHRAWHSRRLLNTLPNATPHMLMRNENYLFGNGIVYGLLIGSAYWLIAVGGDERTVFAVTLMSCMYAIGTTVNSSLHFRTFAVFTVLNLGQGVIFFLIDSHKVDIPIMMTMIVSMILLLRFGHRNAELFKKSVSRRLENVAQNNQLKKNQRDIEASLAAANEANTSKSRFLAAASHDLRQPLHALSLFLGSLKSTQMTQEQEELLDLIEQSAKTLNSQFNSLLDLSQLDSGVIKTNVVMFDLDPVLQNLVDSLSLEATEKNIALTYDKQRAVLQTDPLLLDRILRNILSNALKYTDNGSIHISISSSDARDEAGKLFTVAISDTGSGIAEQDQSAIFEEFTQIGNPERRISKGAGLGLAIVRRIATILNVSITVKSSLGRGSTFSVHIPEIFSAHIPTTNDPSQRFGLPSEQVQDRCQINILPRSLEGKSVLLVEDDPQVLNAFARLLKLRGANVVACASYESAIAIDRPANIALAFIDDMLATTGSGLDIANWLAGYINEKHIVIVTGSENPRRINKIRNNGYKVFTKPLSTEKLDSILLSHRTADARET